MNATLERALRRVCRADGLDPDEIVGHEPRWKTYISDSQRSRVFAEIDAERNVGLFLCAIAIIVVLFGPPILLALAR